MIRATASRIPVIPENDGQPNRWVGLVSDGSVLLLAALCMFWRLGAAPIRDTDEALYASIALAMAHGGPWLIPHLDSVPYIEKPPLLYWLMAISFKLFGVGAWQARLPDALAAWLTALGCIAFGRTVRAPLAGRFAALVVGTALGYVLIARTILFDPLLVLLWLTALACTVLATQRQQRAWLRGAAVALALATLTKGPVAPLLLGLVVVVQLLVAPGSRKRLDLLRFYLDPWALSLYLLLVVPWHWAAWQAQPGFAWFYLVNETVGRFFGFRYPDDFHHGPWWYYGPKLLIGFFQWTPLLAVIAWLAPRLQGAGAEAEAARWARNTAIVLTVFFSAASDKGAYYLLPVVPLVAWWLGVRLQAALHTADGRLLRTGLGWGAMLFGATAIGLGALTFTAPLHAELLLAGLPPAEFSRLPALVLSVAAIAGLSALLLCTRRWPVGLGLYALTAVIMVQFATQIAVAKTATTSQRDVAAVMQARLPADTEWFSWQTFEDQDASLLFYGTARLHVIDSASKDLWFGCHHDPGQSTCVDAATLQRARADGKPVAIWVADTQLQTWLASGLGAGLQVQSFADSAVFFTLPAPRR